MRLSTFINTFQNPNAQPIIYRVLVEKKNWPPSAKDYDISKNKSSCFTTSNIKLDDVMTEFKSFAELTLDFIETHDQLTKLLVNFTKSYTDLHSTILVSYFVRSFNNLIRLHTLFGSFDQLSTIVTVYFNACSHNGSTDTRESKVSAFLKSFKSDISSLQSHFCDSIPFLSSLFTILSQSIKTYKNPATFELTGPFGFLKKDQRNKTVTDPIFETQQDSEIVVQEQGPVMNFPENELCFIILSSFCPNALTSSDHISALQTCLSESLDHPSVHSLSFSPHSLLDKPLSSSKNKEIPKGFVSKALEAANSGAAKKAQERFLRLLHLHQHYISVLSENPARNVKLAAQSVLALVNAGFYEISWYLSHFEGNGQKKSKESQSVFQDHEYIVPLIETTMKLKDLLILYTPEISSLFCHSLVARSSQPFETVLERFKPQLSPDRTTALTACLNVIKQAGNVSNVTKPIPEQKNWTALQLANIDLLRVIQAETQSTERLATIGGDLWKTIDNITSLIQFADTKSLAHNLDRVGIARIIYGQESKLFQLINQVLDDETSDPTHLATLLRITISLSSLTSPLLPNSSSTVALENSFMWTRTLVLYLIRRAESSLWEYLRLQTLKQKTLLSIDSLVMASKKKPRKVKQATGIGALGPYEFTLTLDTDIEAHHRHIASIIFSALSELTGDYGNTQTAQSAFSLSIDRLVRKDPFIHIGPEKINVKGLLSTMLFRLLTNFFALAANQGITEPTKAEQPKTPAQEHLEAFAKHDTNHPFVPHAIVYSPTCENDALFLQQNTIALVHQKKIGEPLPTKSPTPGQTGSGATLKNTPTAPALSHIEYESQKPSEWFKGNTNLAFRASTFPQLTPEDILKSEKPLLPEKFDAQTPKPERPSVLIVRMRLFVSLIKSVVNEAYPLLQVDELIQRVLVNSCVYPTYLPVTLQMLHTTPLGAWFYHLFGIDPQSNATEGESADDTTCLELTNNLRGFVTLAYSRYFMEQFFPKEMNSTNPLVLWSPSEKGFVPSAQMGMRDKMDVLLSLSSANELMCLAEIIGPLGVENLIILVNRYSTTFLVAACNRLIEKNKVLKGDKANELLGALCALGSTVNLELTLRRHVHNFFEHFSSSTAKFLTQTATENTQLRPMSVLFETARSYTLLPSHYAAQPYQAMSTPYIAQGSFVDPSALSLTSRAPNGFKSAKVAETLGSAIKAVISAEVFWKDTQYLPAFKMYSRNQHCLAFGILLYSEAVCPINYEKLEPVDQVPILDQYLKQPLSPFSVLKGTIREVAMSTLSMQDSQPPVKYSTLILLKQLKDELRWFSTVEFDELVPPLLLELSETILSRKSSTSS
ncbi:hypothetical protein BLNAU_18711 [Blattamonas nauphoetae]|uniref:Uncharacterized protein n=1 Tax=Blattamonas nauphoetae TaxID=2049346 RepID=A0ABQ9X3T4_9EUKA|nr:hypothetical protein BLNAU_18711 [Blattamonas nauphoetae]